MGKRSSGAGGSGIDRRVARTRKLLEDALIALTLERGYASITVDHICERAIVGRSTFYAHYSGKADLRRATIDAHLQSVLGHAAKGDHGSKDRLFGFTLPMLEHAAAYRSVHRVAASDDAIHDEVRERLRATIRRELAGMLVEDSHLPIEFAAEFLTGAFQGILRWWVESNRKRAPEEIDRLFSRMAKGSLASASSSRRTHKPSA